MENTENAKIKRTNVSAIIGFLLTLLNLVISSALIITGKTTALFIFASVTASVSLTLCSAGLARSKFYGKGKVIGILGIVINVLIIVAILLCLLLFVTFFRACSGIFENLQFNGVTLKNLLSFRT